MNPDNPSFRTPEEDRRAEEYVALKGKYQALLAEAVKLREALVMCKTAGIIHPIVTPFVYETSNKAIIAFDRFAEGQGEGK